MPSIIDDDDYDEEESAIMSKFKKTLQIECRCCGEWGWYEDIRDDLKGKPDYKYGTCADCEE